MKIHLVVILFILQLISNFIYGESLDKNEINSLYLKGKTFFQEGNKLFQEDPKKAKELYKKAIMHFKRIINDGNIQNGKLYYNTGNIYFRIDDLGHAILNYLKALQYIPNDSNLQQNLEFARSLRKDDFNETQQTKVLKTIFFWHYDISSKSRIYIFIFSFLLIWLFALFNIYKKSLVAKWSILISSILAVTFGISLIIEEIKINSIHPGVIIAKEIIARKGNGYTYEPKFNNPLHCGTEFNLIEQRGMWMHIKLPDTITCWIPDKSAKLVR